MYFTVCAEPPPPVSNQPPPANSPFLNGMMWPMSKQEQDVGMMPPPGTNLVPLSQRRSSTNVAMNSPETNSSPLRTMKQEMMDENSQNSVLDPSELRSAGRYRHISESSMDVHPGDSNMSMINDNSMDIMRQNANINENSNLSLVNENSVEMMMRRNSISRPVPICDSSLDVNVSNSSMSLNDESTCSTTVHRLSDGRVFSQGLLGTVPVHNEISNATSTDELKVMDLRMKLPMATVADLVNTTAPSMATLQSFGVTEPSSAPLPAQSGHSVESFLSNLVMKNEMKISQLLKTTEQNLYAQKITQVMPIQSHISCPVVNDRPLTNAHQADVLSIVAKSEAAAIGEQLNEQTITTTIATTMESSVLPATIIAEKLDAIINCAADTHMQQSPTKLAQSPNNSNLILTSQDVMLTAQNSLIVPTVINTTNLTSPGLPQTAAGTSPNISPDVILNSQISPTLMCRNSTALAQENLLPGNLNTLCHPAQSVDSPLLPSQHSAQNNMNLLPQVTQTSPHLSPNHPNQQQPHLQSEQINSLQRPLPMANSLNIGVTEPEKAILFNAAVDLLETQNKLTTILTTQSNTNMLAPPMIQIQAENSFIPQYSTTTNTVTAVMTSKEFQVSQDKKNEDRMIPQSLATMTENELMNIINPSCFDQGNNFN